MGQIAFSIQHTAGGWRAITRSPSGDIVGPVHADRAQAMVDSFDARAVWALWMHEAHHETIRLLSPAERISILDEVHATVRDTDFDASFADLFEMVDDMVEAAARKHVGSLT